MRLNFRVFRSIGFNSVARGVATSRCQIWLFGYCINPLNRLVQTPSNVGSRGDRFSESLRFSVEKIIGNS